MSSNFIKISCDRFSFNTTLQITICGLTRTTIAKIDTGCMKTSINIKRLGIEDSVAKQLKQEAIDSNIKYIRSYGVNDTEEDKLRDKELIQNGDLLSCASLKFLYTPDRFILGDVSLSVDEVGVSFDRTSSILIGMDIIRNLDLHIGRNNRNNETLLLACPLDNMNDSYINEMRYCFDYIRRYQKFIY